MLRRPPTVLSCTSEDVAAYEDRRSREALTAARQQRIVLQHGGPDTDMSSVEGEDEAAGLEQHLDEPHQPRRQPMQSHETAPRRPPAQQAAAGNRPLAQQPPASGQQTPTPEVSGARTNRTREERIGVGRRGR
jgi:hypothetical protein